MSGKIPTCTMGQYTFPAIVSWSTDGMVSPEGEYLFKAFDFCFFGIQDFRRALPWARIEKVKFSSHGIPSLFHIYVSKVTDFDKTVDALDRIRKKDIDRYGIREIDIDEFEAIQDEKHKVFIG